MEIDQKIDETLQGSYFQKQPEEIKKKILRDFLDPKNDEFFVYTLIHLMLQREVSKEWRNLLSNENLINMIKDKKLSQKKLSEIFDYAVAQYWTATVHSQERIYVAIREILSKIGLTQETLTNLMFENLKDRSYTGTFFYIEAGADINSPNKDGVTPLQASLENLNTLGLESLLAAGVNVDQYFLIQGFPQPIPARDFLRYLKEIEVVGVGERERQRTVDIMHGILIGVDIERRRKAATAEQMKRNGLYHQIIEPIKEKIGL
jgi:hypothetical protein